MSIRSCVISFVYLARSGKHMRAYINEDEFMKNISTSLVGSCICIVYVTWTFIIRAKDIQ